MATCIESQTNSFHFLSNRQRSSVVKLEPLWQCNVVRTAMPLIPSYATPPLFSRLSDSDKGYRQRRVISVQLQKSYYLVSLILRSWPTVRTKRGLAKPIRVLPWSRGLFLPWGLSRAMLAHFPRCFSPSLLCVRLSDAFTSHSLLPLQFSFCSCSFQNSFYSRSCPFFHTL